MISDLGELRPPQQEERPERTRFETANDAWGELMDEIGQLKKSDITERNATFIAGILVARDLELDFLDTQSIEVGMDTSNPSYQEKHEKHKKDTGKYVDILREARNGDFSKLIDHIRELAKDHRDMAEDYDEEDSSYIRLSSNAQNLELIAEKIPPTGDGSTI